MAQSLFTEQELARLRRLRLAGERVRSLALRGERRSRQLGSGLEFGAYRPYSQGDDLRRVDWNVYGRLDQLFLKLFEAPGQLRLLLALDAAPTMDFGVRNKWLAAKRVLAALGLVAQATADRVLLARYEDAAVQSFDASGSEQAFLEAVAAMTVSREELPSAAVRSALAARGRDTVLLAATDMQSKAGTLALLSEARRFGARAVVISLHADEELQPQLEGLTRLSPLAGNPLKLRIDARVLEAYRKEVEDYRRACQAAIRATGAGCIEVSSTVDLEPVVVELLRSGLLEGAR
ncbi:MAG: hypothetical protein HPKKFMNG_00378 [Planctomycetes bacterium]|nr:hypothetical protein [Planctomycetota bacterium]